MNGGIKPETKYLIIKHSVSRLMAVVSASLNPPFLQRKCSIVNATRLFEFIKKPLDLKMFLGNGSSPVQCLVKDLKENESCLLTCSCTYI